MGEMEESRDGEGNIDTCVVAKEAARKVEKAAKKELEVLVGLKAKAIQKLQAESVQSVVAAIEVCSQ